jgi:hypothetical protein
MNIVLWIMQVVLAVVFFAHGGFMVAPPADMVAMIDAQLTAPLRMFIGVAEILAAIGLIAPSLTRVLPKLTPLAAAGLMIIMVSATVLHLVRGEHQSALMTLVLLALATFVTYMRWNIRPIAPRSIQFGRAPYPTPAPLQK